MLDIDKSRQRPGSALEVLGVFERITVTFIHFQNVERKHFGFNCFNVFLILKSLTAYNEALQLDSSVAHLKMYHR